MSHSSSSSNNSGSSHTGSDQSRRPTLPSLNQVFPEHFRPGSVQPAPHQAYGMHPAHPGASSSTQQQRQRYESSREQHSYPAGVAAHHAYPYAQAGVPPRPASAVPPAGYPGGAARPASAVPPQYGVHRMNPGGLETLRTNRQPINHYKPDGPEKPKPHACPECGATFERPSAVQHLTEDSRDSPDPSAHAHRRETTLIGLAAFLCPYCGKTYPSSTNRNRHIRQVHGEDAPEGSSGGARR
ncbi:hypothetical protein AURDEDRAFT_127251 [Auricularia subglabra TFB-10046 SS5]|nr:hypothetical protein AURDEDRAFT_127251 [Auricularia subglabra TFB-10046 SS5]